MPPIPSDKIRSHGPDVVAVAYNMRVAPKVCGVSKSKLYQLAKDGKLKLTRVGGRTLVEHAELMRLIREGYAD